MSIEFPMEIGHIEEIEEHIVDEDDAHTIVVASEPSRAPKSGANQKVVLIQTPEGVTRAVRVQGSNSSPAVAGTSSGAGVVQYIKTERGLVPIRNAGSPAVTHRVAAPVVAKSANKPSYMVTKTPTATKTQTVTKTITMAEARQMGLISPTGAASGKVITAGQSSRMVTPKTASPADTSVKKVIRPQTVQTTPRTKLKQSSIVEYVEMVDSPKEEHLTTLSRAPAPVVKSEDGKLRVSTQVADRLVQLQGSVVMPSPNQSRVVMLPPTYMDDLQASELDEEQVVDDSEIHEVVEEADIIEHTASPPQIEMSELVVKKRPCNCTKSQCLKLYCECFANGEFCSDCNCKECFNTLEHEDERQSAIYCCLERNPNAFRPKIAKVSNAPSGLRHHKGCHCKRSGCLKNYCECFEAKIPCSDMCRCVDCKNSDEHSSALRPAFAGKQVSAIKRAVAEGGELRSRNQEDEDEPPPKQPYNFMTSEVVDATVQCMMAQADECQQNGVSYRNAERLILEEFGRCLGEIIDFSTKNQDS